ncbi:MAG: hypothetical protein A3F72_09025 [Bacteroidetes bacterium RIFCSPLOWO2_12_FULL_35_15]|nr:MAG: hypothetical protein A3F72_09025 [Bacteroidetes bacterium RIFCSPLOWO2_12_FULL_35_15]
MKYFISHESYSIKDAVKLKELLTEINNEHSIFLTSDWESLPSGNVWMGDIFSALQDCDELIVLITRKEAFCNLWINFEVGSAIGRKKKPKILIWGGIDLAEMKYPIKGIHCIGTGDTNRWEKELGSLGYKFENKKPFAELFKQ